MKADAIRRLATLAAVVGEDWWQTHPEWFEAREMPPPPWYSQCDRDLGLLALHVGRDRLRACYRDMLRPQRSSQLVQAVYEIHGAALLASRASRLELHVPSGDGTGREFDVRVDLSGHIVNADSKTRTDEFPFNLPRSEEPNGIAAYFGTRPTVDPFDADELGLPVQRPPADVMSKSRPESSEILRMLDDALLQLPQHGINLVIFGHVQGDRLHLEHALWGIPVLDILKDLKAKQVVGSEWRLLPTGAFGRGARGEKFEALSAVLWCRLMQMNGTLYRAYRVYQNPRARYPLPLELAQALECVTANWAILPSESS